MIDTTYGGLLGAIRTSASQVDLSLSDIIDDYEAFLRQEGVLKLGPQMVVFAATQSLNDNMAVRMLSDPAERKSKADMDFIGLYQNKAVRLIAKPTDVVCGKMVDGEFVIETVELGSGGSEVAARITAAIPTFDYWPTLGTERHRHYLWNQHAEIEFRKRSGGVRSIRHLDLSQWGLVTAGSQELAEAAATLNGAEFD